MTSAPALLWRSMKTMRNWHLQLREALHVLPPKEPVIVLRNGWKISYRRETGDRYCFNEVWLEKAYEPPNFDWSRCKTIIDVGANIGCSSLYFSHRAPQARIISCEPAPENFAMLQKHIEMNGLSGKILPLKIGIDEKEGTSTFYITKTTGGHSLYNYEENALPLEIKTKTLAQLFTEQNVEHCEYLKLDCEGAEYAILYTAPKELLQKIDVIMMEYHTFATTPNAIPEQLKAYLEQNGFDVHDAGPFMFFAKNRNLK